MRIDYTQWLCQSCTQGFSQNQSASTKHLLSLVANVVDFIRPHEINAKNRLSIINGIDSR